MQIICIGCGKAPKDLPDIVEIATEEGVTPDQFVQEDGTYNPENGHFACDMCYIKMGMPSSPTGWKAP